MPRVPRTRRGCHPGVALTVGLALATVSAGVLFVVQVAKAFADGFARMLAEILFGPLVG